MPSPAAWVRGGFLAACVALVSLVPADPGGAQGQSLADQLGPLVDLAKADQAKAPQAKRDADGLVVKNENLQKEYRLYPPQLERIDGAIRGRFAPIKAEFDAYSNDVRTVRPQFEQYDADLAGYSGACTGRQLAPAEYNNCLGWHGRLNHRKAYLDTVRAGLVNRKARLDGRLADFRREEAALLVQRRQIVARMDEIAAQMKRNFDAWEVLSKELAAFAARIDRIHGLCAVAGSRCQQREPDGCEALKHCHSVGWDGARSNLSPLGPLRRGSSVTPNQ